MSWENKVVWSEGLFLRPQHFQQFDRYVTALVRDRTASLRGFGWGLSELQINRDLLRLGKIAIQTARGVLEDGTPFSIPADTDHPPPFEPPTGLRDALIYLAIPLGQPGMVEVDGRPSDDVTARYAIAQQELVDSNSGERQAVAIEVGRLRARLLPDGADRASFVCLAVARLQEVRADRQVVLNEAHVPPCVDCAASPILVGYIHEIRGLLSHRGEALAGRVTHSGARGAAEISDFLLLQMINRYEPLFAHLERTATVHPETLYSLAAQLAGELATFARSNKRAPGFGPYRHDELGPTFLPVIQAVRHALNAVLEQTAIQIPLREHKYGIQVAEINDRTLFDTAIFVLAVRAEVDGERLRRELPSQIKIGPADKIKELVNVALPGIKINALPVAPRQIPFHVGVTYFEIEQHSSLWKDLRQTGVMTLHVSGDFPNLEMALWAIRGQ